MEHRYLVVGLGSMGCRRIRNLRALGVKKSAIFGFDTNKERCAQAEREYDIATMTDFKKAVTTYGPTALIICTPPDAHASYFLYAARHKMHFFVEVTTVDEGYAKLVPLLDNTFVAAPSCTFRYEPAIRKMRELIRQGTIGQVLSFQHYLGQYLPDWHPYEDYREVYFARKKTGGAREMFPYELCWLSFLVDSSVSKIVGVNDKYSDLQITADDIYAAILEYENRVLGTLVIDLLNRKATRTLRIIGSQGTIEWDWLGREIAVFVANKKKKVLTLRKGDALSHYNTTEDIYRAEMKSFVDALNKKTPYPYTFEEDWSLLKTLHRVEKTFSKLKQKGSW